MIRALAITVSNRASAGVYADKSGPVLVELLRSAGCDVVDGPQVIPDGAAVSRQARDFLATAWSGQTLMVVGAQDPVLGLPVMQALRAQIRGCPEPVVLPQAGHFVQEHGEAIAARAVGYFRP